MVSSVVIPTRDRGAILEHTVRRLWEQTVGCDRIEIVVVDNVSTDDTADRVQRLQGESPAPLRYIRMERDRGPAAARNAGAARAQGRTIVFLDSDVELDRRWIEVALQYLAGEPHVGLVGGKLLYAFRPDHINMFGGELNRIGLGWDGHEGESSAAVQTAERCLWAPSSALMLRRELVEQIGLFDESFYFGFEDSDLGWRANLAGVRCMCLPELTAWHHSLPTGRTAGEDIVFHYAKNRLRSMLKNYSVRNLAANVPLYLLYCSGELLVRPARVARVRALLWNLVHVGDTLRERARVQRLRRCQDAELAPYFSPRLLPSRTLARRRRDELTLSGSQTLRSPNRGSRVA